MLKTVIATILIGFFIPLSVFVNNWSESDPKELLAVLGVIVVTTLISFGIVRLFTKDIRPAGLVVSVLWILFFEFNNLYRLVFQTGLRGRYFLPLLLICILALVLLLRRINTNHINTISNLHLLTAIIIMVLPLFLVIGLVITGFKQDKLEQATLRSDNNIDSKDSTGWFKGDVFYIILDSYGGNEVLSKYIGLDNTPFYKKLEDRGFIVSMNSRANYYGTMMSLSSLLHMNYLDTLISNCKDGYFDPGTIWQAGKQQARAFAEFQRHGFKTVSINSSIYLRIDGSGIDSVISYTNQGQYTTVIASMSPLVFIPNSRIMKKVTQAIFELSRTTISNYEWTEGSKPHLWIPESIDWSLSRCIELAADNQQEFVFAHILAPHAPYYFNEDGAVNQQNRINIKNETLTYRQNVLGLNVKIIAFLDSIISDSYNNPIVVLQGDHGPIFRPPEGPMPDVGTFRTSILTAFLVPDTMKGNFHKGMTPVNIPRILSNSLFSAGYPLLEDKTYYVDRGDKLWNIIPIDWKPPKQDSTQIDPKKQNTPNIVK